MAIRSEGPTIGDRLSKVLLEELPTVNDLKGVRESIEKDGLEAFLADKEVIGGGHAGTVYDVPRRGVVVKAENLEAELGGTHYSLDGEIQTMAQLRHILGSSSPMALKEAVANPLTVSAQILPAVQGSSEGRQYLILPKIEITSPFDTTEDMSELPPYVPLQVLRFYQTLYSAGVREVDCKSENFQVIRSAFNEYIVVKIDNTGLRNTNESGEWADFRGVYGLLSPYARDFTGSSKHTSILFSGASRLEASMRLEGPRNTAPAILLDNITSYMEGAVSGQAQAQAHPLSSYELALESATFQTIAYLCLSHKALSEKATGKATGSLPVEDAKDLSKLVFGVVAPKIDALSSQESVDLTTYYQETSRIVARSTSTLFEVIPPAQKELFARFISSPYAEDPSSGNIVREAFANLLGSEKPSFSEGIGRFGILLDMAEKSGTSVELADELALYALGVVALDTETDIRAFMRLLEGVRKVSDGAEVDMKGFTDVGASAKHVSSEARLILDSLTGVPDTAGILVQKVKAYNARAEVGASAFSFSDQELGNEELNELKTERDLLRTENEALAERVRVLEAVQEVQNRIDATQRKLDDISASEIAALKELLEAETAHNARITALYEQALSVAEQRLPSSPDGDLEAERAGDFAQFMSKHQASAEADRLAAKKVDTLMDQIDAMAAKSRQRELTEASFPSSREAREALRRQLNRVAFYERVGTALGIDSESLYEEATSESPENHAELYTQQLTLALEEHGLQIAAFKDPRFAKFNGALGVGQLTAKAAKGDTNATQRLSQLKQSGLVVALNPDQTPSEWLDPKGLTWY